MPTYCIKDASTLDIIASNLTPDEAVENLEMFEEMFGQGAVFMSWES